ncbi:hypothetical protein ACHAW5_003142 [Stephanodiscus triporus]|uniref:Uncharacterized protein n=1 Tax=Stephanodiscus triporus TaxID=2934178 RepID=A0ABD3NVS6_9STRA
MLFSTISRSLINKSTALAGDVVEKKICLMSVFPAYSKPATFSSLTDAKREIHNDLPRMRDGATAPSANYPVESRATAVVQKESGSEIMDRFKVTAEVTISKIFPAGFGWQSSSILARDYMGYAPDTYGFALATGLGDGIGVFTGHCLYKLAEKSVNGDESINMERETRPSAPHVNALQAADLSFFHVFAGTWIGCSTAFYFGLRGARTFLSGPFRYINEPTFENSITDKSLSAAIGGATGFFVGTDTAYLPAQNFLINVVGIRETTSTLTGCAIAGTSTSLGFATAQSTLNLMYPAGKLWNDCK